MRFGSWPWARERGASLMMLDASAANVEAREFYERYGYRLRGVLTTKELDAGRKAVERRAATRERSRE